MSCPAGLVYSRLLLSMPPPLLGLPHGRIRSVRTKRSPKPPHDRVCNLSAIHTGVMVAFVVLVLLGKELTVFVVLCHLGLGAGL